MELQTGIVGKKTIIVTEELTADKVGSGLLPVYATPCMIALAECTAKDSIESLLEEGMGTVGTRIEMSHVSATPLGMKVTCTSTLTEIDRKKLVFHIEVEDEAGLIGEGTHERFLIQNERFLAKALEKGKKQ